jgi:hypothetical protein
MQALCLKGYIVGDGGTGHNGLEEPLTPEILKLIESFYSGATVMESCKMLERRAGRIAELEAQIAALGSAQ